jgi:hypothetical protein
MSRVIGYAVTTFLAAADAVAPVRSGTLLVMATAGKAHRGHAMIEQMTRT